MINIKQSQSNKPRPRIVIFTGDNLFSYILCKSICRSQDVKDIVVSRGTTHSFSKIFLIFRRTSIQYFIYRVIIQLLSKFTPISELASLYDIKESTVSKKSDFNSFKEMNHHIGVTCNFDLIIPDSYINSRSGGVLNIHASDLPLDRGISPVVWAFCRGDTKIYISYYLMDGGIDTGEIVSKDIIEIDPSWSLFRSYCEVVSLAAKRINSILFEITQSNTLKKLSTQEQKNESYNSWPSKELNSIMKRNGKKYFKSNDIRYAFNLIKDLKRDRKVKKY